MNTEKNSDSDYSHTHIKMCSLFPMLTYINWLISAP